MADDREQESSLSNDNCVICATVTIGLERISVGECVRKLNCRAWQGRGRIYLEVSRKDLTKVKELRSVENLFVVVSDIKDFDCLSTEPVETILERFERFPEQFEWDSALATWKEYTGYKFDIGSKKLAEPIERNEDLKQSTIQDEQNGTVADCKPADTPVIAQQELAAGMQAGPTPSFRVTCTRVHSSPNKKHAFTSMEAAGRFGSGINGCFGWKVDLEDYDLEVLLNIVDRHVVVGISLTKESLFRRNIVNFGPTTLRSTLAYCLAVLAEIKPGDIVCDPMCGGGSISLEGAINYPETFNLCGDNFVTAPSRTKDNIVYVNDQRKTEKKGDIPIDTFLWDACNLPLKTNSVDVFITDLPFGKKSGSLMKNWQLYPQVLSEMARVCRPSTGRAVLLTKDKKVMSKISSQYVMRYWKKNYTYWINFGGLEAGIYVFYRTPRPF